VTPRLMFAARITLDPPAGGCSIIGDGGTD
jgi:hypothetical protein